MNMPEAIENACVNAICTYDELMMKYSAVCKERDELKKLLQPRGRYECFHCGKYEVSWDCNYDFSDFNYEGEGIVQMCHCNNCGAEIEYRISLEEEE